MSIIFLRTIILYFLIVVSLRIMGKRQIGELQPAEFVVTILISNLATLPIENHDIPLLAGIVPILTLVSVEVVMSAVALKCNRARRFICGNPLPIICDGVIDQQLMKDLRYSVDDLMEQLRINNIFDIKEVAFAIVETTGKLSVYRKFSCQTPSTQMLGIPNDPTADAPPIVLISDGRLMPRSLEYCGLDRAWLDRVLKEHGLTVKGVYLMTCDRSATYHLVPRHKKGAVHS